MAPQKSHTETQSIRLKDIRIGKLAVNPMTWLVLCVGSLTPFGQWSLAKMGVNTPNADIEQIKKATDENKAQIAGLDRKVSALIVEVENLRMQRNRTAGE